VRITNRLKREHVGESRLVDREHRWAGLFPVALFDAGLSVWRRVERLDHGVGSFAVFDDPDGRVRLFGRQFVVIFRDGATVALS
jgi:hypothetical protein